ncbi:MAG: ACT domain-containing protein, partial [Methanomicrobia archaeon]|nr:ACT domain-containing protein [Methanomicrobia archaeon]
MRAYDLIKIKNKGIIELPEDIALELGIVEGAYLLAEIDERTKEISFERIALPGKDLVEIEAVLEDKPGVLAKIASELGKRNINILFNESDELEYGNLSALVVIVDISKSKIPLEKLEKHLSTMEFVKELEV